MPKKIQFEWELPETLVEALTHDRTEIAETIKAAAVLQIWSRSAVRIVHPQSTSPWLMEATARSKAASFSRMVPKSGMVFTARPPSFRVS